MNYEKEISLLHKRGYVILKASRSTNAPVGWKQAGSKRWGYTQEMADPELKTYKNTFSPSSLAKSHCGFYLGHGGLCCIDLDTKKTTIEITEGLKSLIIKQLGDKVAVETTKSNGFHIYFNYSERLANVPDFTGKAKNNWIELYYSKRFIACYLSDTKRYKLVHGTILNLQPLTKEEHTKLMKCLAPYKTKESKKKRRATSSIEVDKEIWDEAENYIKQLEEKQLDITGDEPTWFRIGKALASAFGYKGLDMFNRISMFSPLYNADEIEEVYKRYVEDDGKRNGEKITIATFFKMCVDAGLNDLRTAQTLQLNPPAPNKEYQIIISKKDPIYEKTHAVVTAFRNHLPICCLDSSTFYVFKTTHWELCNSKEVMDLIYEFLKLCDIDARIMRAMHTVPYIELILKELRLTTLRNAIEPHTGSLREGIFINLENGILHVNVKSGKTKQLDHDHSYNFTTVLPYPYDAEARCPKFDAWMDKQIPNKALHELYYAFVASCLTRHKADIIMLLAGPTSTGKSSLIEITRRLIGIDNSAAISAAILFSGTSEAQTQAMQMENKLLAYDFDAQPFKNQELLLKMATGEPLPGWQMHVARRPVVNYGRLIIAMNPNNYSVFNDAIARRFITIPMEVKIEKDNSVMPAIYENEMSGIFNKVLTIGIAYLEKHGGQIRDTAETKAATLQFHMSSRDAVRWFEDHYIKLKLSNDKSTNKSILAKLTKSNPGISITFTTTSEMYEQFRHWMEFVEGYTINKIPLRKHFAADLKQYGIEDTVIRVGDTLRRGCYIGIKAVTYT
jgi:phage/plasmid-associated DNA primase